ncbi:MAG: peptidoglycan-binding protein [Prochlorothrix sp.]|mgnify:CR=1 FL=1|nr:peptidoglycan-binding protein [Prochlorothrix sp.]
METLAYLHLTATTGVASAVPQDRSRTVPLGRTLAKARSLSVPGAIGAGLVSVATLIPLSAQAQATLSQGSSGPAVVELQQQLASLGYFNANATGYYGSVTVEAVRQFQAAQGLQVDGVAGPATQAALSGGGPSAPSASSSSSPSSSSASSGFNSATADLQADLADLGYYRGQVDGMYGPLTEEAIRNFERDSNLPVTGVVSIQMLNALDAEIAARNSSPGNVATTPGSNSSSAIPVIPPADSVLLADNRSGDATKQDSSKVVVQKAADEIVVRQGSGTGSIVVQQHPERTLVEAIPSTSVVVSQPNAPASTTIDQRPVFTNAQPSLPFTGAQPPNTPYANYPPALPPGNTLGTFPVGTPGPGTYSNTGYGGTAYASPPGYDASFYPYVVAIPHRTQEDLVTALRFSPGAFVAGSQRGTYINAGSYSSRAEAETLAQALRQQGLDARVIFRPR